MIGTTLCHFKITAKLGEGDMGEGYRAEDTKLGREVAIKVLPETVATDPERLARFEREAKVLASLNHPSIAAIHSCETAKRAGTEVRPHDEAKLAGANVVHFLVIELGEGETLADKLCHGRLSIETTLPIALQIACALEAAHEHRVIHRDLKPGNVMVTPEGQVKVLDFGLAKALAAGTETGSLDAVEAPTFTAEMTRTGVVMGTASYMSPEQVRAATLDKRTDIWSLGVVLFEMLTGRRLFAGESISDTMAEVLKTDPDLEDLPANLPGQSRALIGRCLNKDVSRRLRDIGEARIALEDSLVADPQPGPSLSGAAPVGGRTWLPWLVAGVFAILAAGTVWQRTGLPPGHAPEVTHTSILLPDDAPLALTQNTSVAVSPDGSLIAFVGGRGSQRRLFIRRLDADEATPVDGTEGAESPIFSPSGEWIGFVTGTRLKRVTPAGGPTQDISFMAPVSRGLDWVGEDAIVMSPTKTSGLLEISASTGAIEWLTRPPVKETSGHCWSTRNQGTPRS